MPLSLRHYICHATAAIDAYAFSPYAVSLRQPCYAIVCFAAIIRVSLRHRHDAAATPLLMIILFAILMLILRLSLPLLMMFSPYIFARYYAR